VSSDWAQRRWRQRTLQKYTDNPENLPEEAWDQVTDPLSFGVASALRLLRDRRLPQRRVIVAILVFIGGAAPALLTLAFPRLDVGNPVVWAVTLFVAGLVTLVPAQVEAVYGRSAGRRARCSLWRIDIYAMTVSLIALIIVVGVGGLPGWVRGALWAVGAVSLSDWLVLWGCADLQVEGETAQQSPAAGAPHAGLE
jgi:hypothetical protein